MQKMSHRCEETHFLLRETAQVFELSKVIRRKYTTLPKNEKIEGGKARWRKKSQCEGEEKVGDIVTYGKLKKKKSALPQRGAF